ncbi:MAG: competence/damage-inducible protein A [Verrucomicrobiota bacterium]
MRIEILNTGTELMLGHTVNTHGAWIGRELFGLGLRVSRQTTVPDGDAIREALAESVARTDALLVTGGLGPTSDDLTREITAGVLGLELIEDEAALRSLEAFFEARNKPMADANRKQVLVPPGADVLPNPNGTAPGIYIPPRLNRCGNCAIFLLPGPPRELQPMFHAEVIPRLRALAGVETPLVAATLRFCGIGESDFHEGVDLLLAAVSGLEYGYCAHIGEVELRLIGAAESVAKAREIASSAFPKQLVSDDGASLPEAIVCLLKERGLTLATAESCTGGLIAQRITQVPGASVVFTHGFITYSNGAKTTMLGVPGETIESNGAVSEAVARAMAEGGLAKSGASFAISVTGIAGPDGGTAEKPAGTAWLALAGRNLTTIAVKVFHPHNRLDFQLAVSQSALDLLRRTLGAGH